MIDYICEKLNEARIQYSINTEIPELDALYTTRVQKERFDESEYAHIKSAYILTAALLEGARSNLKALHPLSRVDEIIVYVDKTPHDYYFEQAENDVYTREVLLALLLNQ